MSVHQDSKRERDNEWAQEAMAEFGERFGNHISNCWIGKGYDSFLDSFLLSWASSEYVYIKTDDGLTLRASRPFNGWQLKGGWLNSQWSRHCYNLADLGKQLKHFQVYRPNLGGFG